MQDRHWRDRNFAHRMDRRHRRSTRVGRVIVAIVIAYLLGACAWYIATAPPAPPDDVHIERIYRP